MLKKLYLQKLLISIFAVAIIPNVVSAAVKNDVHFAYVTQSTFKTSFVFKCTVGQDGLLSNCNQQTGQGLFAAPKALVFNNNIAYVGNYSSRKISQCSVDNNGELTSCQNGSANPNLIFISAMTLNNKFVYVANNRYPVSVCDPAVTSCALTGDPSTRSIGIAFNNDFAYITNEAEDASNVIRCKVDNKTGKLSSDCKVETTSGLALINFYHNYAYISQYMGSNVSICEVDANGDFSNCAPSTAQFVHPTGIAFFNNAAYVANNGNNNDGTISRCSINEKSGDLYNCQDAAKGFNFVSPWQVVIH